MADILDQITAYKRDEVAAAKTEWPLDVVEAAARAAPPVRPFAGALEATIKAGGFAVIGEIKKASPSKGLIRKDFDPGGLAEAYAAGGATCLSVLTDGPSFSGAPEHLTVARAAAGLPVLRKDFMLEPWQVWEARATGADSFLLIVAILSMDQLRELLALGRELGMEALVEVHQREELLRAVDAGARIIGVNNRDLRTLEVRVETSLELIEDVPDDCLAVSESGVRSVEDLERLRAAGYDAFLVGEHLMESPEPAAALQNLLRRGAAS